MGQQQPLDAQSVLQQALEESMDVGVLAWCEEDVPLTDEEKEENIEWLAGHLLAALHSAGFRVSRKEQGS
jgi:hypothetical protein